MPAASDRSTLIAALDDVWTELIQLGATLTETEWQAETDVPGWSVKDNYSHIIGTELMLLNRADPTVDIEDVPHVKNDIGRFNEVSIVQRRATPGVDVLAELTAVVADRRAALEQMDDAAFAVEGFTPAGTDTYGRFMQIRVMDCWVHEQDVRCALDRHGHLDGPAATVALDEMAGAMGYVLGKKVGVPDGQSVRLDLTGPLARVVDVRVDGRAAVVDDLENPTATVRMPVWLFVRYAGGRRTGDAGHPEVVLEGDTELGTRVVENLAYMI